MPVFSSAYFPSLAYVNAIHQAREITLDLHEYFVKQSIRTRSEILSANGVIQLNVPILHAESGKQTMREVKIDASKNWQTEHWRAIESAYANAPTLNITPTTYCVFLQKCPLMSMNSMG